MVIFNKYLLVFSSSTPDTPLSQPPPPPCPLVGPAIIEVEMSVDRSILVTIFETVPIYIFLLTVLLVSRIPFYYLLVSTPVAFKAELGIKVIVIIGLGGVTSDFGFCLYSTSQVYIHRLRFPDK